jgi:hypothetical protein
MTKSAIGAAFCDTEHLSNEEVIQSYGTGDLEESTVRNSCVQHHCHYYYWMPDRACPQLDWGSGMTAGN